MAKDPLGNRYDKRKDKAKLDDRARRGRSTDDLEAEEELIRNTEKVDPIEADKVTGRNDPCPCGSGKKYKKCCGRDK